MSLVNQLTSNPFDASSLFDNGPPSAVSPERDTHLQRTEGSSSQSLLHCSLQDPLKISYEGWWTVQNRFSGGTGDCKKEGEISNILLFPPSPIVNISHKNKSLYNRATTRYNLLGFFYLEFCYKYHKYMRYGIELGDVLKFTS